MRHEGNGKRFPCNIGKCLLDFGCVTVCAYLIGRECLVTVGVVSCL
jgi:hypothetical protein